MHELSLMQGIFDSVIPVAEQNGASRITNITLSIGERIGIVPEVMEFAFEALSEDIPLLEGCEFVMEFIPAKSQCVECGTEFEHDRFHNRCPECNSAKTLLITGRELHVKSMEYENPD